LLQQRREQQSAAAVDPCATSPCTNGGKCLPMFHNYTCLCPDGFEGRHCKTNFDDCAPSPCMNGGRCVDEIGAYRCLCAAGFEGKSCETNIDDCTPPPCKAERLSRSCKLMLVHKEKVLKVLQALIAPMGSRLSGEAVENLKRNVELILAGAEDLKDYFVNIDLNGEWGGTTALDHMLFGFSEQSDGRMAVAYVHYAESFTELNDWKLNLPAWDKSKIEKYMIYEQYLQVSKTLHRGAAVIE